MRSQQFAKLPGATGELWSSQETHAYLPTAPKYQPTDKIPSISDNGNSWCAVLNSFISSFHAVVIVEYLGQWWQVRRVAVHNEKMYCVTYLDHDGRERKAFILRKINPFKVYEE